MAGRKRVEWIDIAKFLGIFAVYIGHLGNDAGLAQPFVFTYHVPFFFFISGCMMNYDRTDAVRSFTVKKAKGILLPFYSFALLSLLIKVIQINGSLHDIKICLYDIALGCIRNTYFAASLWFLTALFVMEIVFKIMRKLKYPAIIVLIALAAHFALGKMVTITPDIEFRHFFNWDWAMYYLLYFTIGFYSYSALSGFFELDSNKKRGVFTVLFLVSAAVAVLVFEKKFYITGSISNEYVADIVDIGRTLILIAFNMCAARLLCGVPLLSEMGKETLYLCGNEWIVEALVASFLGGLGLTPKMPDPTAAYVFTFVLIVVNVRVLIPFEKAVGSNILRNLLHSER